MVEKERIKNGRKASTTMVIVDAQSVKNTDTAKEKGYDAGKKVSGIKRHIAVDTQGLPHAITVTTANVGDRDGATQILKENKKHLKKVKKLLADGGYTGKNFEKAVKKIITNIEVEITKRSDIKKGEVTPKRWVVERSFAWLEKNRRLWKNCERLIQSSIAMVQLAFIKILLKRS